MYRGLVAFLIFFTVLNEVSSSGAEPVKIGFLSALSGPDVSEGKLNLKAIQLAVKQINGAGGLKGRPIDLVAVDVKSTPQGALEGFQQLMEKEKVFVTVGPLRSAQIIAVIPEVKKYGVPVIVGGSAVRLTQEGGRFLFRTRPNDAIVSAAMVKYVKQNTSSTRVAIVSDTSAFGVGGANYLKKAIADMGLTLVKEETYTAGDESRFEPIIKSLKESKAEVAFVYASSPDDQGKIMLKRKQAGNPFIFFGSPTAASKIALSIAKDAAEGVLSMVDVVVGQSDASRKYADEYQAEYGEEPDTQSLYAYDGLKIIAKAVNEVGLDRDKLRDYLFNRLKNYPGVIGRYNFDAEGNGLAEASIVKVEKGKPKLLKIVSADAGH